MKGSVGPASLLAALFLAIASIVSLLIWAVCGMVVKDTRASDSDDTGIRVVTEHAAHSDDGDPAIMAAETREALRARGEEWTIGADANNFLDVVSAARAVTPFTLKEASAMFEVVASAVSRACPEHDPWFAYEAGMAHIGTTVPRLRIEPQHGFIKKKPRAERRASKGRFEALDAGVAYAKSPSERIVGLFATIFLVGFFVVKAYLFFSHSHGPKPPVPTWVLWLAIAAALFAIVRWLLVWRRMSRAEWVVYPTASGFSASSKRFADRRIDVIADACWATFSPVEGCGHVDGRDGAWIFLIPKEPWRLVCPGFDPTGTPWQAWLEEFSAEVQRRQQAVPADNDEEVPSDHGDLRV